MYNKQVNFIDTRCPEFYIKKVKQIIENMEMYSKAQGCILLKDFLSQPYSIIEAFKSTNLLLIEYISSLEKIEGMDSIFQQLEDIVQKATENNPKKLVVIGDTKDLHALFKFKCNTIDKNGVNILSQLTEESQSDLLQKIQVNLYDRQLKCSELMDEQALVNIVGTPQLLQQLLIENLVIVCGEHQRQRSYYKTEFIQETFLSKSRIVIISGESGSGKNTCLQKLKQKLIESPALTWVVGIHLDKTDVINKLEEQSFKGSKIDLLIELIGYQGLQRQMFAACVAGKLSLKLDLVVYGFGERLLYSSKDSKKVVKDILKELQSSSGNINIYVTCESQSRTELEDELNAHVHELDPFTPQKKIQFMIKCLRSYPDSDKVDLSKRAQNLLQTYEKKQLDCLIDTTLKLKMLTLINLN
ncbi:uncharacterized protein LOC116416019 [Nasonia vitripennis]|uniref:Uncharacterized protein n=1 Tax=Nasonia vitripennis TaxID=7425 RepID=A0A7M7PWH5_NASVI|nr:uncharacterized protein LOC116416019 [Nasonia vitripennis]